MLPGGFTGSVWCMALQGTNVVVGGYFSSWNGNSHHMYKQTAPLITPRATHSRSMVFY